jgi:hypothetical protein
LRRFACANDPNKVMILERHGDVVVAGRKSIDHIGYDEGLYDYFDGDAKRGNSCSAPHYGQINSSFHTVCLNYARIKSILPT